MDHENHEWGHVENLYSDFGVTVRRVYLDKGQVYSVKVDNGFSSSVSIVSGYGIVYDTHASMEIKPGRVIVDGVRQRGEYELKATSSRGLTFIETAARAIS